jgi:spore coat protein U-like protein
MKALKFKTFVFAVALGGSAGAMAASNSTTLTNTTTITSVCSITGTGFTNNYDPVIANALTGSDVHDGTSSGAYITLGQGSHSNTGSTDASPLRRLAGTYNSNPVYLSYNLYSENTYSTVWGNTEATGVTVTQDGTAYTDTVYVDIPKNQNQPVGTYSDSVIATINF